MSDLDQLPREGRNSGSDARSMRQGGGPVPQEVRTKGRECQAEGFEAFSARYFS